MKKNGNVIERILFCVLLISCSIQNKSFSSIATIDLGFLRMDILDMLIIISIILLLIIFIMKRRIEFKFNIIDIYLSIYLIFLLIIGVIKGHSIFNIFLDIRVLIYLLGGYLIFKNSSLSNEYITNLLIISGLINSVYYIVNFMVGYSSTGLYIRDVSFNLFIGTLAIGIIVFYKNKQNFLDNVIILLVLLAAIISQQRTIIIPNIVILILYIIKIIKNKRINIITKICLLNLIVILGCILFSIIIDLNFKDTILNRFSFENFLGKESTLWMRTESINATFNELNFLDKCIGTGLGSIVIYYPLYRVLVTTDALEMFFFNYLYKYGIIGTTIIVLFFASKIFKNRLSIKTNSFSTTLVKSLFLILIGGFISGLERYQGQFLIGMILGLILKDKAK